MPEYSGWKNRNRNEVRLISRGVINQFTQRHLRDIIISLEHSGEHCGDIFSLSDIKLKPRYPNLSAQDRQQTIISAAGELDLYWRSHHGFTGLPDYSDLRDLNFPPLPDRAGALTLPVYH